MKILTFEEYMESFEDYLENTLKKETPEESKKKLIQMGVLDKTIKK